MSRWPRRDVGLIPAAKEDLTPRKQWGKGPKYDAVENLRFAEKVILGRVLAGRNLVVKRAMQCHVLQRLQICGSYARCVGGCVGWHLWGNKGPAAYRT